MAQQFPPQFKSRLALLVFLKGAAAPMVLYFENPKAEYEDFLNAMLDMDEGSRGIGEIAIGTNDEIQDVTGNILFDEKIGGSIHMAVGASYPETGGKNVSGLHWDMIKNMKNGGKIFADDVLIYENGKFII